VSLVIWKSEMLRLSWSLRTIAGTDPICAEKESNEGASENEYIPDAEKEDAPENEDLPDAEEEVSENEDLPDASERQEDVQKKRSKRLLEKRRKNNRVAKAVAAYEAVAMTGPRSRATVQPINITKAGGVNKGRRHARQALIERVLRAFPAEDQRPSAFDGPF